MPRWAAARTDTVLGGRQAVTILTKVSWWCGGIFLALSLILSFVPRGRLVQRACSSGFARRTPTAPATLQPSCPRLSARAPRPPAPTPPAPAPAAPAQAVMLKVDFASRGDRVTDRPAFVLLEDGAWFAGTAPRPIEPAFGEVVFTTNLTGYQETFTDPSYLGQIVVMTAPMIGNYGVNGEDMESARPQVRGVVVRELSRQRVQLARDAGPREWLAGAGVPMIEGVDTRRLTRHIRERGRHARRRGGGAGAQPRSSTAHLLASRSMEGLDLASRAGTRERHTEGEGPHVVAYDFGMKRNIVRMLVDAAAG